MLADHDITGHLHDLHSNHAIGDAMSLPKDPGTTRIHFQNVNGLSVRQGGTWEIVVDQWKQMEVDIALACEHKIDTTSRATKSKMYAQATTALGQGTYTLTAASTPNSTYPGHAKSGGTLALVIGSSKGRIADTTTDEAGRWVSVTFRRQHRPNLVVICITNAPFV